MPTDVRCPPAHSGWNCCFPFPTLLFSRLGIWPVTGAANPPAKPSGLYCSGGIKLERPLSASELIPRCNYAIALFQMKASALAVTANVPPSARGGRLFSEWAEKNHCPDPIYHRISGRIISNLHCKLKTKQTNTQASIAIAIRIGAHLAKEFELTLKPACPSNSPRAQDRWGGGGVCGGEGRGGLLSGLAWMGEWARIELKKISGICQGTPLKTHLVGR